MKYCNQCGGELVDGARFCSSCGAPVGGGSSKSGSSTVKCPQCGERIDAFVATCPSCGHELRGTQTLSRVRELEDDLEGVESPKKRSELIRNFYIPNTKEDIYEFVILASSNLKAGGSDDAAWNAKLEQAIQKAELVFGDGPELDRLKRQCKLAGSKSFAKKVALLVMRSKIAQGLILLAIGSVMFVLGERDYSLLMLLGMTVAFAGLFLMIGTIEEK